MVTDNDALSKLSPSDMEAAIHGISDAPEPGTARAATMKELLTFDDDGIGAPSVGELKKGAGHVYIWDTRTYERSIISKNLLSGVLTWKRPDQS